MRDREPALVCRRLRLRDYRNFPQLELDIPAAGALLIGDNGSGKTNLLEAIYYLEIFRSFRGASDEQLVRFGRSAFHIRGEFEDLASGRAVEITAAYEPRTRTKRIRLDGVEPDRISDAIGKVRVVVFAPSDMALVQGGPAERRRFLDIVLSVNQPAYLAALQEYRRVLRQRNALLRAGGATALLEAWDAAFIDSGARVLHGRARWVAQWAPVFAERYRMVGDGAEATLAYRPGLRVSATHLLDAAAARVALEDELRRVRERERERGVTLVGPHRDDLAVLTETEEGSVDLRDFGSGGQVRTAAIALRLVEAETARQARGSMPIILLDDVFAELDPGRSRRILELLETQGHGQVLLTAPKPVDVQIREAAHSLAAIARWTIRAGRITAAA